MLRYAFCTLLALAAIEAFPHVKNSLVKASKPKAMCTSAQMQTVQMAYTKFLMNYGLPMNAPFMNYSMMYQNQIFMGGYNGQVSVCQWQNQLVMDLMGMDSSDACMNVETLQSALGVSMDDAGNYMVDYRKMSYECGDGYQLLMDNFYCLRAIALYDHDLDMCDNNLNNSNGTCSDMNDYITCYRGIYQGNCGMGAGMWICNLLVADFNAASMNMCMSMLQSC